MKGLKYIARIALAAHLSTFSTLINYAPVDSGGPNILSNKQSIYIGKAADDQMAKKYYCTI
jgi:hypothetical protein